MKKELLRIASYLLLGALAYAAISSIVLGWLTIAIGAGVVGAVVLGFKHGYKKAEIKNERGHHRGERPLGRNRS